MNFVKSLGGQILRRFYFIFLFELTFMAFLLSSAWSAPYVRSVSAQGYGSENVEGQGVSYDAEQLNLDKVLITNHVYNHIFEPYLNPVSPVFITSDVVLSAFHVLLKESVAAMEEANAQKAIDILKLIWSKIAPKEKSATGNLEDQKISESSQEKLSVEDYAKSVTELRNAAGRRAQIVIAVAIKLLEDNSINLDEQLNRIVGNEVSKIVSGEGIEMPEWTGVSDSEFMTLDYSRYKPRGLYTQSELLKRYFMVLSWLRSIPFRVDNDVEFLSILLLGKTLNASYMADYSKQREIEKFFRYYRDLTGQPGDRDLLFAAQIVRDRPSDLETVREYLVKRIEDSKERLKEKGRFVIVPDDSAATTLGNFKIISEHRMPDTYLFQRTTGFKESFHSRPSGLEICAVLGSDFALEQLVIGATQDQKDLLYKTIDNFKPVFKSESLYKRYLNCLAELIDDTEHDAPDFMSGKAWKIKSCNTVLSGWSQFRSTWELPSRYNTLLTNGSLSDFPIGFVEPEPEFFGRLGRLVEDIKDLLERSGAFVPPRDIITKDLRVFAGLIKENKYPKPDEVSENPSEEEIFAIDRSIMSIAALGNIIYSREDFISRREVILEKILSLANNIEKGKYDDDPNYQAFVLETNIDTKQLWMSLCSICKRLEVLAHKQLRDVDISKEEKYFLIDFGEKLISMMLCDRYSYPRSVCAAPGITRVYLNPDRGGYLHVGIGRPRLMYVLYPYKGKEVLCHGAVSLYYEFVTPELLTDEQWKERLGSNNQPENPVWLKPIITP